MAEYVGLLTLQGQAAVADAIATGTDINISHMAVGNGNGAAVTPLETMTGMVNEVWRGTLSSITRNPASPTQLIITAIIPIDDGPFTVREVAIFTSNGQMFAIASHPAQDKTIPSQGSANELTLSFIVVIDTSAQITIDLQAAAATQTFISRLGRVPFIAVESIGDITPPANPTIGQIVVVGANATGVFQTHDHKLAQYNGTSWLLADAPEHTVVGVIADGEYYRRTKIGWALFDGSETKKGLMRFATAAEVTAGAAGVALQPSHLTNELNKYLNLPIYPEIIESGNVLAITAATGQITIDAAQSWLHRGWKEHSTDDYVIADRQFVTIAGKTYHLRWSPAGGFALKDLADTGYNPGSVAETDSSFDTDYDDMLVAKIITDVGNVPTVTALANAADLQSELYGGARNFSGTTEADHVYNFYFAWARTPKYGISALHPPSNSHDTDYELYSQVKTREHLQMWSWTWQWSAATSYPSQSLGFQLNMEA